MIETHIRPAMEAFAALQKTHIDQAAGLTTSCTRCTRTATIRLYGQFLTGTTITGTHMPLCSQHAATTWTDWQTGTLHELAGKPIVTLHPARLPL